MRTKLFGTLTMAAVMSGAAVAQEAGAPATPPQRPVAARPAPPQSPPAAPAPGSAPATPAPRAAVPAGQLVNIKVDVVVVESGGAGQPTRKNMSLMLADRQNGSVRSMGTPRTERAADGREVSVPLRMFIDAFPVVQPDGRVQVQLTLEYGKPGETSIRVEPLLQSGRMMVVSESADPGSDRRVSVELTATVLK